MDNKKFEQLINLITNESTEQARALFHDIVVEKSREIYESMMDEDEMSGQVGDLLDEINAEEEGMTEDEDEFDDIGADEEGDGTISLDDEGEDDLGDEGEDGLEDRVVDLEDKLDELMAEFEELMAGEEGEEGEEEFSDDEGDEDFGDDEGDEFDDEEGEEVMESTVLQPVKGLYNSKIGGDDGAQTRSPALTKPKVVATGAKPVAFSSGAPAGTRTVPAPKEIPGTYKNAAGQKKQDLESAPKPTTSQATGTNTKSVVGESRKARK